MRTLQYLLCCALYSYTTGLDIEIEVHEENPAGRVWGVALGKDSETQLAQNAAVRVLMNPGGLTWSYSGGSSFIGFMQATPDLNPNQIMF